MLDASYDKFHDSVNHDSSVSSDIGDLLTTETDVVGDADRPNNHTEWRFQIMGSCNGLLCISFYHDYRAISHTFLWNPCLRMSKKLPPVTTAEWEEILFSAYGISYDEPNDDYKVVGLFRYIDDVNHVHQVMVNICSLKNDSWKRIEDFKGYPPPHTSVVYANGKFHFPARLYGEWSIASLDLEKEVYGTIELPNCDTSYSYISIAVLKGCISAIYSHAGEYADVWVLKEYGNRESWTKLVSIPYQSPSSSMIYTPYCLCLLANGKYLLGHGRQLLVYNPEDNSYVCRTPKLANHDPITSMDFYVESLVPL